MSQSSPPPPPSSPPPPPPPPVGAYSGAGSLAPAGAVIPPAWKRILARFLDWLIVTLVFGSILSELILNSDDDAAIAGLGGDASFGKLYLISLLSAAVWFVWDAVCTKQFGGSPMKLAFGMKVVQQGSGQPVEWGHAIIRWAVPGALSLVPFLGGLVVVVVFIVSLVFVLTKPLRQAVWDLAAKTIVVER
jgi:uncharacterized RDD family membrane protein YckC